MNKVIPMRKEPEKKRVLFTHLDLDGIGCAVIFLKVFPESSINFCEPTNVNEVIMEQFIQGNIKRETNIMITDLHVNEDVAAILDTFDSVDLIDHHASAKWLEDKYPWAMVEIKQSATKSLYEILSLKAHILDYKPFVDLVDEYDMWGYGAGPSEHAKDLSRLNILLGHPRMTKRFILSSNTNLSEIEANIILLDKEKEDIYVADTIHISKSMVDSNKNQYAFVIADRYINTIAHEIMRDPAIEYIMILDMRKNVMSLRGKGKVNLGDLAKQIGGGGHAKAAGFPLDEEGSIRSVFHCGGKCKVTGGLRTQITQLKKKIRMMEGDNGSVKEQSKGLN